MQQVTTVINVDYRLN